MSDGTVEAARAVEALPARVVGPGMRAARTARENALNAWRRAIQGRAPKEWARLIGLIEDPGVRERVACIVWWDFFSIRPVMDRWAELDAFLAMPAQVASVEAVEAVLLELGYLPRWAHERARTERMRRIRA